jgi:hypothetical protein
VARPAALGAGRGRRGALDRRGHRHAAQRLRRPHRAGDGARQGPCPAEVEVGSDGATLVAHGLPAPPSGRVYQIWLKRPGKAPEPTSALFTPRRDGTATATVPGDLGGVSQMLVTDEPRGGSRQPTTSPLLSASMS